MGLTENDKKICEDLFKHMDQNGDDLMSVQDMFKLYRYLGYDTKQFSDGQICNLFIKGDTNGDRRVSLEEFFAVCGKQLVNERNDMNLRAMLKKLDKDDTGIVSVDQFKQVLVDCEIRLSDEHINAMIKEADTSGDGQLNMPMLFTAFKIHSDNMSLTEKEKTICKRIFANIATTNDSQLTIHELIKLYRYLGYNSKQLSDREICDLFVKADRAGDKDSQVSVDEFLEVCAKRPMKERNYMALRGTVNELIKDGIVSTEHLKQALSDCEIHLNDERLSSMIKEADASGGGQLKVEEFFEIFRT